MWRQRLPRHELLVVSRNGMADPVSAKRGSVPCRAGARIATAAAPAGPPACLQAGKAGLVPTVLELVGLGNGMVSCRLTVSVSTDRGTLFAFLHPFS
jgi:hypothetical protein